MFVAEEQIQDEIDAMIDFVNFLYDQFGVVPRAELSTRRRSVSAPTRRGLAEGALEAALKRRDGVRGQPGRGHVLRPKIDLHMTDVLGRSWQMGTIQVDYHMPRQFGLTYMGADNREHSPVVIHRALLGSLERFIGILIEHYGGAFLFWLAPVQVRLIPVGADHRDDADALAGELREPATASTPTTGTRRWASGSAATGEGAEGARLRRQGVRDSLAVRDRGGEQATRSFEELVAELATLSS